MDENVRSVPCPTCNAGAGDPCLGVERRLGARQRDANHVTRIAAWQAEQRAAIAAPYHAPAPETPEPITDEERQRGRAVIAAIREAHPTWATQVDKRRP